MFISDAAFQFVIPSSFSDSVPAGSLGFGALSDGMYVKDSAGLSSRVLLVKDCRDDVRTAGLTDSSLVTETGIRNAILAHKQIPDGVVEGQVPTWDSAASTWALTNNLLNKSIPSGAAILDLWDSNLTGGYQETTTPHTPYTRWGLDPIEYDSAIEITYYDVDSPLNASAVFTLGPIGGAGEYIRATWAEEVGISLFFPHLDSVGLLTVDEYGEVSVDINSYEISLGLPASNGMVLSSTTLGVRSWVSPPPTITINNQGDHRILTSTSTSNTLNAESRLTYEDSQAQLVLVGDKTTQILERTITNTAMDYSLLGLGRGRGTLSSYGNVQDGDTIGVLAFQGYSPGGFFSCVTLTAYAEDTFGSSNRGGSFKIATVPEGSLTSATRIEITKTGVIKFNNAYSFPTTAGTTDQILKLNASNELVWATDSSGAGTVTSVAMTVPTGLSISGTPITTSGTLALTLTSGYSIPTTANQTNWSTAYTHSQDTSGSVHGSTTVGGNLLRLANPSAVRFIKINSTNTIATETAATFRTSLGATTVGGNFFTTANPSAITFPRVNADNTVTYLSAVDFRTAIGAGTGNGTVTSVSASSPLSSTGGATPTISIAQATTSADGYLSSTDWNTFNNKVSSQWVTVGSHIYYTTGRVAIGTDSPGYALHVVTTSSYSIYAVGTDYGVVGQATNYYGVYGISTSSRGVCGVSTNGYGGHFSSTNGAALYVTSTNSNSAIFDNGNVGIGFGGPQYRLHVEAGSQSLFAVVNTSALSSTSGGDIQVATKSLPTAADQQLGTIGFQSRNGVNSSYIGASIHALSSEAWTAGSYYPSYMVFKTCSSTSSTPAEVLKLGADGYTYVTNCLGVGSGASPNSTILIAANSTTGAASIVVKSDYAIQSGSTGNQSIAQLDLRHIGTTTAYSRILLRYNKATAHYEHIQTFLSPSASGTSTRNYMLIDGYTGLLTIESGISDYKFNNTGKITFEGSGNMLGIGVTAANTTSALTFAASTAATGGILFGTDTNLYRSAVSALRTDDDFSCKTLLSDSYVQADKESGLYIGTKDSSGSWRIVTSGTSLVIQYWNGSSYVTKQTLTNP